MTSIACTCFTEADTVLSILETEQLFTLFSLLELPRSRATARNFSTAPAAPIIPKTAVMDSMLFK